MRKCFVIMPFSDSNTCTEAQWTEVFQEIIVPAVRQSRLGFECVRSQIRSGAFIKDILSELNEADVVIADLTDRNPNVFYELGVRHTLRNRTILISQALHHVPSDLRPYGVVLYDRTPTGIAGFKKEIRRVLKDLTENPERPDNPVSDFLKSEDVSLFKFDRIQSLRKLTALISELSNNLMVLEDVRRIFKEFKGEEVKKRPSLLHCFRTAALEELVGTNYIVVPAGNLRKAHNLLIGLSEANKFLDMLRTRNTYNGDIEYLLDHVYPDVSKAVEQMMRTAAEWKERIASKSSMETDVPPVILRDKTHGTLIGPPASESAAASNVGTE
jgi:SepF-like predicted cell division protein (DUF552 family)